MGIFTTKTRFSLELLSAPIRLHITFNSKFVGAWVTLIMLHVCSTPSIMVPDLRFVVAREMPFSLDHTSGKQLCSSLVPRLSVRYMHGGLGEGLGTRLAKCLLT